MKPPTTNHFSKTDDKTDLGDLAIGNINANDDSKVDTLLMLFNQTITLILMVRCEIPMRFESNVNDSSENLCTSYQSGKYDIICGNEIKLRRRLCADIT